MQTPRVSTLIRLKPELLDRAKLQARRSHLSLNAYVERELEQACGPVWPVFPQHISDEILRVNGTLKMPSPEKIAANPRLKHILAYDED